MIRFLNNLVRRMIATINIKKSLPIKFSLMLDMIQVMISTLTKKRKYQWLDKGKGMMLNHGLKLIDLLLFSSSSKSSTLRNSEMRKATPMVENVFKILIMQTENPKVIFSVFLALKNLCERNYDTYAFFIKEIELVDIIFEFLVYTATLMANNLYDDEIFNIISFHLCHIEKTDFQIKADLLHLLKYHECLDVKISILKVFSFILAQISKSVSPVDMIFPFDDRLFCAFAFELDNLLLSRRPPIPRLALNILSTLFELSLQKTDYPHFIEQIAKGTDIFRKLEIWIRIEGANESHPGVKKKKKTDCF